MNKDSVIKCIIPDAASMQALGEMLVQDVFSPSLAERKTIVACSYGCAASGKSSLFGILGNPDPYSQYREPTRKLLDSLPPETTVRSIDLGRMYWGGLPFKLSSLSDRHIQPMKEKEVGGNLDLLEHVSVPHLKDADYVAIVSFPNKQSLSAHNRNPEYFSHLSSSFSLCIESLGLKGREKRAVAFVCEQMKEAQNDPIPLSPFCDARIVRIFPLSENPLELQQFRKRTKTIRKSFPAPPPAP